MLPESSLGKAIGYLLGLWTGLTRFLDDARIPLDNNQTERGLRGVVLGRRNHYGSRSRRGTQVAALFYSLIESAKLCGVEPKRYLLTGLEITTDVDHDDYDPVSSVFQTEEDIRSELEGLYGSREMAQSVMRRMPRANPGDHEPPRRASS